MTLSIVIAALSAACVDERIVSPEEERLRAPASLNLSSGVPPNGGCVPDATVTREGQLETIVITFGGCSDNELVDGSPFGVNFGDGDPNTPPGDPVWRYSSDEEDVQDMPSPPAVIYDVHVPRQKFFGFDPPVRSVEFYYANWPNWVRSCELGECEPTFNIYGMSGFMTGFLTSTTESVNNPGGFPVTNWTNVSLSWFSDAIYWVYMETLAYVDHLKIVRAATPTIECDTVPRGSVATCTITEPVDEVVAWRFEGLLSDGFHTVPGNHTGTDWDGMVVAEGDVFAEVVIGGIPQELWGPLDVLPRDWRWGEADWDFIDGSTLPSGDPGYTAWAEGCFFTEWVIPGLNPQGGTTLGVNGMQEGCQFQRFVDPRVDADTVPDDPLGASYAQVPDDGGPNAGIWYVTEPHYRMDRRSAINSSLTPDGPTRVLTFKQDTDACDHLELDPLDIGWYTFNVECKGIPADFLVEAIWLHEGYGSLGVFSSDANGHQARLEWAASLLNGDPFYHAESPTAADRPSLHEHVGVAAGIAEEQLLLASDTAHVHVRNNGWCEQLWVYHTDQAPSGPKNRYRSFQFGICP